ncbi:uncharacterized protein F4817DRAFT_330522 [Daldinia loculata]|uniref:uncharacterized protein n=1 Tax=Daldinia loculata TaxID=103429 RepID=UPI0020C2E1D8|nr:uncharacterized protein F4817DRAFT_330522 [Daldinia loculata]KAI1649485.1 hypothetical protein F4817DRAFT_330522 [Daldinia loculata]
MSRYHDSRSRGRSSHHRDRSPGYTYSGGDYPISYEESRQLANTTNPTYDESPPLKQLTYEPHPSQSSSSLQIPESRSRPRSLPSGEYRRSSRGRRKDRDHDRDSDSEYSDDSRTRTPIDKARNFVDNNFSNSTAGLGIGVLGALVGGLAAREAVDATNKNNGHHHHETPDQKRKQLIGTMVGAAVGALGANAVEKRLEVRRERDRLEQEEWERRFRSDRDVIEKREVIARPRGSSGSSWRRDWDERDYGRSRSRGLEREVDPEARSWKNVEDWLNDERDDDRPRSNGRRSADGEYRY